MIKCEAPPDSTLPREVWEMKVFSWGSKCYQLHNTCAVELSKSD